LNDKIVIKINNGNVIHSTVDFIDPVSSINSSSTLLRSVVNNSDLSLRPGQYADGVILAKLEEEKLIVPKTAVLWTGKRSVAYVKIDSSIFELRNVTLGQESDDFYSIEDGLELDEKVVYKAVFTVDAASQLQGKKSMMNSDTKSEKSNVSNSEVNEHTNEIISLYLSLKDHLVDSNTSKSQKSAEEIHLVKSDIPGSFYDTKNGQLYLGITNKIKLNADKLSKATDLEEQREIFESISISMIELVESFDIENVENKLYVQHCPMAFDNKGADWISNSDKILNPYFGASMLRCGSVIKEY
jgi:Cu(I)/Ag(I) efflux system membrane fusion protein